MGIYVKIKKDSERMNLEIRIGKISKTVLINIRCKTKIYLVLKIMEGYYENFHLHGETWRITENRRKRENT